MKSSHVDWVENNIEIISAAFGIPFYLDNDSDWNYFEECVDIYDSEEEFDRCVGDSYKELHEAGMAECVDGKYLFLMEVNI